MTAGERALRLTQLGAGIDRVTSELKHFKKGDLPEVGRMELSRNLVAARARIELMLSFNAVDVRVEVEQAKASALEGQPVLQRAASAR